MAPRRPTHVRREASRSSTSASAVTPNAHIRGMGLISWIRHAQCPLMYTLCRSSDLLHGPECRFRRCGRGALIYSRILCRQREQTGLSVVIWGGCRVGASWASQTDSSNCRATQRIVRIPMIGNRMCTIALTAASAIIWSAPPASAARFDGNWSMVAETTRGHCGTIAVGLGINHGRIHSTGGSFAFYSIRLGGRVSGSGQVRMKAIAGPRIANGTGRFSKVRGSGTWAGRGPSGLCSGVWSANRS